MEGRRYKEEPAPINESLERHYKEEKARLETKVEMLETELNEKQLQIERLHFKLKLKDIEIESLVKAMAGGEMNV